MFAYLACHVWIDYLDCSFVFSLLCSFAFLLSFRLVAIRSRRLYDRYGAKRMLYANFFEYVAIKDLVPFFTPEDREWILGRTAMKVYRIQL